MPKLTWPGKILNPIIPSKFTLHSHVYPGGEGYPSEKPTSNLYLGDNLGTMEALLPEYSGKIDLIYADPPFFTNKKFQARIGRGEDSRIPSEWKMDKGYSDHWDDLDEYLDFLYPRLKMMHRLLSPVGSLYLHRAQGSKESEMTETPQIFVRNVRENWIAWLYHG